MLCRKPILLVLSAGFGFILLAEPARSDQPGKDSQIESTALHATVQEGVIVGEEQHRRVLMKVNGRRLLLAVPQDFRAVVTNPEKVLLVNRDHSIILSFHIAVPGSGAPAALNVDHCRAWLSARFEGLKIQEEFSMMVANVRGPAFDFNCKVDGVARSSRVAFISSPVGVLEFSSSSSPEQSEAAKANLRFLLRSFRISEADGQLQTFPTQSGS